MNRNTEFKGHLLALITIFIWGTTFISTKVLLRDFTPIEILFIRFVIGLALLFIIFPHRLKVSEKKHELYFAAAGLCGVTLYYLLENIALTYTFASNVGVIVSISPFVTAIFAHLFLNGEKLRLPFFLGFVAAMIGIFLISFNGSANFQLNPLGDILAVLSVVVWAVYSVFTKKISAFGYNTIQTTRRTFFYGLVFMVPALFIFGFDVRLGTLVKPVNLFNILFLGLGASALCFVAWNSSLKILGVVKTTVYVYIIPVVTVVTSAIVLKERLTPISVLGIILTLAGLFISDIKAGLKFLRRKDAGNPAPEPCEAPRPQIQVNKE